MMKLRKCEKNDLPVLIELFRSTVWTINAQNYSQEQLEVYAPDSIDPKSPSWQSLFTTHAFLAEDHGEILGFANMTDQGYIDFFYIHHRHIRKGIGQTLYDALEKIARKKHLTKLTVESSLTARSFFEAQGFTVVKKQEILRKHVLLENYLMEKTLG